MTEYELGVILLVPMLFSLFYPLVHFYNKAVKVQEKPGRWVALGLLAAVIGYLVGTFLTLLLPEDIGRFEWILILLALDNLVPLVLALLGCAVVDRSLNKIARERNIQEVINEDNSWQ